MTTKIKVSSCAEVHAKIFMRACHYQEDMQRCGPSEWVIGVKGPEIPELDEDTGKYDIRIRGFFPGQPFRDYEEECEETVQMARNALPLLSVRQV